jgi:hypothetical protein
MSDTPTLRVVVIGNHTLIGQWSELGGMPHLREPLMLVPIPVAAGQMGWAMIPFPIEDIELTFIAALGEPESVYRDQYIAQLAELKAAKSGIALPGGARRGPRLVN